MVVRKGWERWDQEMEADSQAGRLDFLGSEEKAKGTLMDLSSTLISKRRLL